MKIIKSIFLIATMLLISIGVFAQENSAKVGEQDQDFKYTDINGKTYTLSDFAGKYIYLDVWATWCGPCKREIPFFKELEKKMHGKNIEFVSLSTDKNVADWESFVKKNDMSGIQLHNGGDRVLSQFFDIKYIPRFIIIGQTVKVVEQNELRPSSEDELVKYLDALPGINK